MEAVVVVRLVMELLMLVTVVKVVVVVELVQEPLLALAAALVVQPNPLVVLALLP
jgi:hypothetical protein